ncbi:MAG: hypothetical protein KDD62_03895, partial [Bdellovibrionales bacterium]|nr:hypothetical protein [Bdellovibrionales bacterium]
ENCLKPGGTLWLDTKNLSWIRFQEADFFPESALNWFMPEDLIAAAEQCGFRTDRITGFLPEEGSVVAPERSHTMVYQGTKLCL